MNDMIPNAYPEIPPAPPKKIPYALKAPVRFGARMLGMIFLLRFAGLILILLPLSLVSPMDEFLADGGITEEVVKAGTAHMILSFFLLPIETFLGQSGPIWLFSKIGVRSHRALCVLSAIIFAVLHLSAGVMDVLSAFFAGLVLSHCWLSWRPGSFKLAFWGTTLVHVAHNAIVFPLFIFLGSVDPNFPS